MNLVKFRNRNFPWYDDGISNWMDFDDFYTMKSNVPEMNVKNHKNDFEIEMAVPGFSKEEIKVSIEDDMLHVSAEKSKETEEKDDDYSLREFSHSSFERKLKLPPNIKKDAKIKATCKNGILKLHLPKDKALAKAEKKVIEIS